MVQELDPREQWLRDQDLRIRAEQGDTSEGMIQRVRDQYSTTPNFANLLPEFRGVSGPQVRGQINPNLLDGQVQYGGGPFDRGGAEQSYYNRFSRFAEPNMQEEERRLHERLVSQGFNVGSEAYRDQMRQLSEQQQQQRADWADRAVIGGGQEASAELARLLSARQGAQGERLQGAQFGQSEAGRLFGQETAAGQFQQGELQRQLADMLSRVGLMERDRARPLNEMNAFRTGQQVQTPTVQPQFSTPNLTGTDIMGAARAGYQDQLGAWNAQQASGDNFLGGLMGLAGMTLGGPIGGMAAQSLFSGRPNVYSGSVGGSG